MIIALPREQEGIILIPMAKKEYLSPEMKEVKFVVRSLMSIVSGGTGGCPTYVPCDDDCEENF